MLLCTGGFWKTNPFYFTVHWTIGDWSCKISDSSLDFSPHHLNLYSIHQDDRSLSLLFYAPRSLWSSSLSLVIPASLEGDMCWNVLLFFCTRGGMREEGVTVSRGEPAQNQVFRLFTCPTLCADPDWDCQPVFSAFCQWLRWYHSHEKLTHLCERDQLSQGQLAVNTEKT